MKITDELRLPNDTKELDTLLNERGQDHRVWPSGLVVWHDERTVYEYEPAKNHHSEYWGGILRMTLRHCTPEQAIDATLGRGTCHNAAPSYLDFLCSECGFVHYHSDTNDTGDGNEWRYCPNCGRKVVDDELAAGKS